MSVVAPPTEPAPHALADLPPGPRRGLRVPPMLRFIVRRLLLAIPVLIGITFICFGVLAAAPGDPVRILMGQHYDPVVAEQIRADLGLDKPFLVQYARFAGRLVQGDLGRSYVKRIEVAPYLWEKFGNTLLLAAVAMMLAVLVGLPAGVFAAAYARRLPDTALMVLAVLGVSMPIFWLAMMAQLVFADQLRWLPVSGMGYAGDQQALWSNWPGSYLSFLWHAHFRYWLLPGAVLATIPTAVITRLTRSSMLETLGQDYIRTARAKGLTPGRIIVVHALRNALIPIVTVIGLNFAALLTGAVLTETVFAWPGIGRAMVEAISQYDYPVVLGGVILMSGVFVAVNLVVDLLYGAIDPRVRVS